MSTLYWLSDKQWEKIKDLMPNKPGPQRIDDRQILSGIIHVLRAGCRWCDCPKEYGSYTTVYNRFNRWSKKGIWQAIYVTLTGRNHPSKTVMTDSSYIKAHRSAAGGKGGNKIRRWVVPEVVEQLKSMR